MNLGWRQVNVIQLFRVDERHLGQGKGINTIAFRRSPKVPAQGSYLLHFGFHQPAVRMAGAQIDSYYQPCQTSGLEDYDGISSIPENTFF